VIILRPFRPEDASSEGDIVSELLADGDPLIGITAESGGRIVAYGGLREVHGRNWAFFRVIDESARKPAFLHRTAIAALAAFRAAGIGEVLTFCDRSQYRAEEWLLRLGFKPMRDEEKDLVIRTTETQVGHATWVLEA
jgi:hypothetical protein